MNETPKKGKSPKINFAGPIAITVEVLAAIFLIWAVNLGLTIYNMITHPRPAPMVSTALVENRKWPVTVASVTQLQSTNGTVLKSEVSGTVREIAFTPGQSVKKGDLLLVIESSSERAQAKLAKLTYERALALREQGVNSQNDLDQAEAAYAAAQAELDKKEIRSPFDGKVGLNEVFVGQYVTPGVPLVAVESLSTMLADFSISQRQAPLLAKAKKVLLTVDAFPCETFEGNIEGSDPRVDSETLTISARATIANPDEKLLGGMFGTLEVYLTDEADMLVLPATALSYGAYGTFVYVVETSTDAKTQKSTQTVKQKFVKVGVTRGDFVAITSGLMEGEEVVVAGQMKLRNNLPVQIDNTLKLPASETPKPTES